VCVHERESVCVQKVIFTSLHERQTISQTDSITCMLALPLVYTKHSITNWNKRWDYSLKLNEKLMVSDKWSMIVRRVSTYVYRQPILSKLHLKYVHNMKQWMVCCGVYEMKKGYHKLYHKLKQRVYLWLYVCVCLVLCSVNYTKIVTKWNESI